MQSAADQSSGLPAEASPTAAWTPYGKTSKGLLRLAFLLQAAGFAVYFFLKSGHPDDNIPPWLPLLLVGMLSAALQFGVGIGKSEVSIL